jgi:glycosyltransferase involved in cell wall biosynthesis
MTYKRAWILPYSLLSIASQTRKPDEVVVLKTSRDGSEEIISKFSSLLPIKLLIQRQGNFTDAIQNMAIGSATGDLILFINDGVAEEM